MIFKENKEKIFGLKSIPSFEHEHLNDMDYLSFSGSVPVSGPHFSDCVSEKFSQIFCEIKKVKNILEIGVDRPNNPNENSSTKIIFNNKRDETVYLGVDLNDKSNLDDPEKNIHTLKSDSMNKELVYSKLKELKIKKFDFIFIDGWHSINAVMYEWENYVAPLLSKSGVCLFHDVNTHPGPYYLFECLDRDIFEVSKYCNAMGLGVVRYRKDLKK